MLKRFRQLRIPLAAKCQILYGAAVVLTIGAALVVPWQRINQLYHDLNEKSAAALAQQVKLDHVARQLALASRRPMADDPDIPTPATLPTSKALAATQLVAPVAAPGMPLYIPPRLIGVNPPAGADITTLDRLALDLLARDPNRAYWSHNYRYKGTNRFRYALPLYDESSCVGCHQSNSSAATSISPSTEPSTRSAQGRLLGIVAVDIPGIDDNQLFLNRLLILMAGTFAGCVAIAVFYFITTRVILRPVRVLQETAEKVSQGDLDIRSDINTGDEFQQLSQTINTMLANLKTGSDQLRSTNKALDLKLDQLAQSNVALYESNRLKSEFLANVSHELRTPLNSILGFAELLKDTHAGTTDGKPARYLQNILSSGRNLLELINDLLDLAKIEAGRMEVRSVPLSLGDVFEGLINLLKPLTEPRNLAIIPVVENDVPIIHTDAAKLQQVLYNFLSNAIKFSPPGSQIDLKAELRELGVYICVIDSGPGIDSEQHGIIFEKFRQIDGSVTRQHSGTGLGLAISRELITLMGGTIGVTSTPGHGATFWIILPLNVEPGARDVRGRSLTG